MYFNGVFLPDMMSAYNISLKDIKGFNFIELLDFTESYKAQYNALDQL